MYKLQPSHPITRQQSQAVVRLFDDATVPFDPANTDYQAYLKWLEEGNTPLPADDTNA
jgi:hypothetical protein